MKKEENCLCCSHCSPHAQPYGGTSYHCKATKKTLSSSIVHKQSCPKYTSKAKSGPDRR